MQVDALVLDIDGVLVDVSNSYRRAIVRSVAVVYGDTVPKQAVQSFKDAGGFNNDWVVTDAVALYILARAEGLEHTVDTFTRRIKTAGGGREGAKQVIRETFPPEAAQAVIDQWDPERLRRVFQQLYLGPDSYRDLESAEPDLYEAGDQVASLPPDGFMADEPVLIEQETVDALAADFELGVVTGRPRAEAELALDRVGLPIPDERLFAMENLAGKPDPSALITVAKRAGAEAVAFAGDTKDDVRTARNATEADPDRTYHGIGVLTGGLSGDRGREVFNSVGASAVIETVNELPEQVESR